MVDRQSLRLAGVLLPTGELVLIVAGLFHPGREQPNDHQAVFAEYAASGNWIAVHLGQFIGSALLIAGLLALYVALNVENRGPAWLARFAAVSAIVTLVLTAILQAVDGVALKHAVEAWVQAPAAERASTFANAELVRWLEWSVRSYQRLMLGATFLLFGAVIVWTGSLPRPAGYLASALGLAYFVQAWIVGAEGFSPAGWVPSILGLGLELAWVIWVAVVAWRLKEPAGS